SGVLWSRESMLVIAVVLSSAPLMSQTYTGNPAPDSPEMTAISAQPSGAASQERSLVLNSGATDGTRYVIAPESAGLRPEPKPIANEGVFPSPAPASAAIRVPLNPLFAAMKRPAPQAVRPLQREGSAVAVAGIYRCRRRLSIGHRSLHASSGCGWAILAQLLRLSGAMAYGPLVGR